MDPDRVFYFDSLNPEPLWNSTTELSWTRCMAISSNGSYIAVGDGDNAGSAQILLFHQDKTSPSWDINPKDQFVEFGSSFYYHINASDSSGISHYWVNDTINFNITTNGLITNISSLNIGEYLLEIRAYDPDDNFCSAIINISVVDTTAPTWDPTPEDQLVEFRTEYSYDVNASDLSGIAYYWINDTNNFEIDENGLITNASSLNAHDYWLQIRAYDPYNNYCDAMINVSVVDSTPPLWDPTPEDKIIEFRTDISYDVDASDLSGIADYWINNTVNFNIDSNGLITNATSLNVDDYWLEIRAYNPSGMYCSAIINISVVDTTAPTWDIDPIDQNIELGSSLLYNVDASDYSGIAFYWINDTTYFNITLNGLITNLSSLSAGNYWLEIRAYDTFNNYCNATIKITVALDITAPTWDLVPKDQIIEFGTNLSYDVDASDLSGIAYYWINDTVNFNIDSNGLIENTISLNAGEYWLEIRAYDPYDNYCNAIIKITVNSPAQPPQIPGYELSIMFSLVGIILIVVITYIQKKYKVAFIN
ncbi:MAG: Ig-like domain-containing protein [Candidatus Thorarchaeota archaeon]